MEETGNVETLREVVRRSRSRGARIGFVATMGYLHEGHLELARQARAQNGMVVMSIYVNPTQFGPGEDLDRYPRDLSRDRELAERAGVDLLFTPESSVMYPDGPEAQHVWVDPGDLAEYLEGASRPGHFRGVCTVVAKLFHMVEPDMTYFGQKDAQQAIIVSQMVKDLGYPIDVRVVPTVREADGLALSSRNVYLSPEERGQAPSLHAALRLARSMLLSGTRDVVSIESSMRDLIARQAPGSRIDYATIADASTLRPCDHDVPDHALIALAVYFGRTRLIDNLMVRSSGGDLIFS